MIHTSEKIVVIAEGGKCEGGEEDASNTFEKEIEERLRGLCDDLVSEFEGIDGDFVGG